MVSGTEHRIEVRHLRVKSENVKENLSDAIRLSVRFVLNVFAFKVDRRALERLIAIDLEHVLIPVTWRCLDTSHACFWLAWAGLSINQFCSWLARFKVVGVDRGDQGKLTLRNMYGTFRNIKDIS